MVLQLIATACYLGQNPRNRSQIKETDTNFTSVIWDSIAFKWDKVYTKHVSVNEFLLRRAVVRAGEEMLIFQLTLGTSALFYKAVMRAKFICI